jgi:hypothetical protein
VSSFAFASIHSSPPSTPSPLGPAPAPAPTDISYATWFYINPSTTPPSTSWTHPHANDGEAHPEQIHAAQTVQAAMQQQPGGPQADANSGGENMSTERGFGESTDRGFGGESTDRGFGGGGSSDRGLGGLLGAMMGGGSSHGSGGMGGMGGSSMGGGGMGLLGALLSVSIPCH